MLEDILHHPNRAIVNRRLANTPLCCQMNDVNINIFWLNYNCRNGINTTTHSPCDDKEGLYSPDDLRPFHRHSFYEIHLCTSGLSIYQVHEQSDIEIHPGEAILIRANQEHRRCHSSVDHSKISISFSLDTPQGSELGQKLLDKFNSYEYVLFNNVREIVSIFTDIYNEVNFEKMGYIEIVKLSICRLIILISRLIPDANEEKDKDFHNNNICIDSRVHEIDRYINSHLSEMITTSDIASNMHLSTKQINRILQNEFDTTGTDYIAGVKCYHAKQLLAFSDISISEIAAEIGYSDVFSFSKFFKRVEGMSPALFRKSRFSFHNKK